MEHFGIHRSVDPRGVLPQQARVLDARSPLRAHEMAVDVEYLNIDSASWRQLREECGDSASAIGRRMREIVAAAGKMHNPVTGSGGMLVGRVSELGERRSEPPVGTRVASLVSLTLTPLVLDEIVQLDPSSEKVRVRGRATLFGSSIFAEVPDDLGDEVVLGVLDVCGAPAWMARAAKPGMHVAIIGAGGKSGMLAAAQARANVGAQGRVLGLCWPEVTVAGAEEAGAEAIAVDCTDAVAVRSCVESALDGGLADLVFVCANVPGCEGAAILSCRDDGRVVFFSMATSFTTAALSAEGLGKYCEMTIGNGFVPGHAQLALDLVRSRPRLLERFAS
ncbi:L-erythro-3,5-diaminohexanoate dehydrogenase [soil metagenome]